MSTRTSNLLLAATSALLAAGPLHAEPTLEVRLSGAAELTQGDPESSALDARGLLTAGPVLDPLGKELDGPITTLLGADGTTWIGTSGAGLWRADGKAAPVRVAEVPKLVVNALARHRGRLLFATGPAGAIEAVDAKGTRAPFADPSEKYIWAMVSSGEKLVVATGEPGRVLEIGQDGASRTLFDSTETHLRTLAIHPRLGVLVGGGQKGIVYQLRPTGGAFALYDSSMDEITSIVVDPRNGDTYVAAVSESKPGVVLSDKTIGALASDPADTASPVKGSEIVRIRASGSVEVLWTSRREGALQLALDERRNLLLVATGAAQKSRGRLYGVDLQDRDRVRLLARVEQRILSALVPGPEAGSFVLGSAPVGQLLRLGPGLRPESVYVSAEQDLQGSAQLGSLWFDADVPSGAVVELAVRTGNTRPVDETWSAWSAAVREPLGGRVQVPEGRYLQLRATMRLGSGGASPVLKALHASIQRRNLRPSVDEVYALRPGTYLRPLPPEEEKEKTVVLSATTLQRLRRSGGDDSQDVRARQGLIPGMMTIAWRTEDPNKDALLHRIEIRRAEGSDDWRVLADGLDYAFFTFDSRGYPDGRYLFRVTSTDRPGNTPEEAMIDSNVSEPVLFDNTAPRIAKLEVKELAKGAVRITVDATDDGSVLGTGTFSIDGGPWVLIPAADGLVDARTERFEVTVRSEGRVGDPKLGKGPHVIAFRVDDERGNLATSTSSFLLKD